MLFIARMKAKKIRPTTTSKQIPIFLSKGFMLSQCTTKLLGSWETKKPCPSKSSEWASKANGDVLSRNQHKIVRLRRIGGHVWPYFRAQVPWHCNPCGWHAACCRLGNPIRSVGRANSTSGTSRSAVQHGIQCHEQIGRGLPDARAVPFQWPLWSCSRVEDHEGPALPQLQNLR